MWHLFWDWFYLLTFSCSLIIKGNACLNNKINIYIFSVIFLSNFKYFLIKLLNWIKVDHLHALNADVLYYLLNIELSDILYISIIFKVFKVVFIVRFMKQLMKIFYQKVDMAIKICQYNKFRVLFGHRRKMKWFLSLFNFSHFFCFFSLSLITEPKYQWLFSTCGFCILS